MPSVELKKQNKTSPDASAGSEEYRTVQHPTAARGEVFSEDQNVPALLFNAFWLFVDFAAGRSAGSGDVEADQ
jgi:hypothetical protein